MGGFPVNKLQQNPVVQKLRSGKPSVGTWLTLCSPQATEAIAHVGWEWLVVDAEHSPVGFDTMTNCFRAAQLGGAIPMARVPWNDTVWIQRTLDAGALGLVIPMVNSREEAEAAVASCKYAPLGDRSAGGCRFSSYVPGDYVQWAQDNIAVIVMIEHIRGAERAEEILSVPGVDGCFIGPNDLGLSMGLPRNAPDASGRLEKAMADILAAGKKVGTAVGKHCYSAEEVNQRIEEGYQFLALASDQRFMIAEAQAQWKRLSAAAK